MYCGGVGIERTIVVMHALVASASPLVRRYTLDEFFALEPPPGVRDGETLRRDQE